MTRNGNVELLKYLLDVGCEATVSASNAAAACNQLECLKVLHNVGCPVSLETAFVAIHCGSLQCLQFLHSIDCGCDEFTLERHNFTKVVNARGAYGQAFPAEQVVKQPPVHGTEWMSSVLQIAFLGGRAGLRGVLEVPARPRAGVGWHRLSYCDWQAPYGLRTLLSGQWL